MSRVFFTFLTLALLLFAPLSGAMAVMPDEVLKDPKLEERARALSAKLRCLVCQNQSIDDSDAPLARDLRILVRDRLKEGDTDSEVMTFLTDRYGDFILLQPPFKLNTLLLWFSPLLVLAFGIFAFFKLFGGTAKKFTRAEKSAEKETSPLSKEEEAKLKQLLES